MFPVKSLSVVLLFLASCTQASTRAEIERLWHPEGMAARTTQPAADAQ
ncbi:type-F conjugative transfer system pilin assembly thiol-disulfide isomerase TrbB, partial [Escherichia coli]